MKIIFFLLLYQIAFATTDVTKNVEVLGNPYADKYKSGEWIYARNIWDMQIFANKLFIGAGNSNNFHPAPNAGRVPVFSFDPKNNKFYNEYTVAEEQIDRFRVIDNRLYIPGHDATQKWDFGNFYTRTKEGIWEKYRTIPNALHVYDIVKFGNELFVALGLNNVSAVGVSSTEGQIWSVEKQGASYGRIYSFLKVSGALYACKSFTPKWHRNKYWSKKRRKNYYSIGEYDGLFFKPRYDLDPDIMFPNTYLDYKKTKKIIRSEFFGDKSVYIGAYILNNGHQSTPFGAYIADSLKKGKVKLRNISLPDGYTPWDIIVRGKSIYILCYDHYNSCVSVMHAKQDNLDHWYELFNFKSFVFARSFELLNGDFYFGLGYEVENPKHWKLYGLPPETGNILRIKQKHYKNE